MAKSIHLILGVHNHQPVDNFEHVMEEATEKCYRPFLNVLEAHPKVAMAIHYTGYLLGWLQEKHPDLIVQLKRLIDRGQVEMFTGGYYEPILATIPAEDKRGQITKLTRAIQEQTGAEAQGLWLAERVWEPHLTEALYDAGVRYFCVDDAHFKSVGMDDEELMGRYTTEEMGKTVDIFPVSKDMRYLIPYAQPHEVIEYLKSKATEDGQRAAIYFDDGEKFGVWPGTYQSVFEEGWLDRFFQLLEENTDVIKTVTPRQYVDAVPSFGRIYLPTASYSEMLEWALPAKHINALDKLMHTADAETARFLRGGFWRHFLVKYPESNHLHKKMLHVSRKVAQATAKATPAQAAEMQDALWRGQSNDTFWHGVFGGLYLTNLRTSNYQNLIRAEVLADKLLKGDQFFEVTTPDFDCDNLPEILVETPVQSVVIDPGEGGGIVELDYRPKCFNLIDTLTRRYEAYHDKLPLAVFEGDEQPGETKSIHDRIVAKERNLGDHLHYDWHRRISLLDHFFGADATLDSVYRAQYPEQGDFVTQPYDYQVAGNTVTLSRTGSVWVNGQAHSIRVEKALTFAEATGETIIDYTVTNLSGNTVDLWFAPEFHVNVLAPDAYDRYYYLPETAPKGGGAAVLTEQLVDVRPVSKGELTQVAGIGLKDEWMGIDVALHFERPADVWRFPIETISQSEAGFERVYQSSAIYPNWRFSLAPQANWTTRIRHIVQG
jgi:hypothetical protein